MFAFILSLVLISITTKLFGCKHLTTVIIIIQFFRSIRREKLATYSGTG